MFNFVKSFEVKPQATLKKRASYSEVQRTQSDSIQVHEGTLPEMFPALNAQQMTCHIFVITCICIRVYIFLEAPL